MPAKRSEKRTGDLDLWVDIPFDSDQAGVQSLAGKLSQMIQEKLEQSRDDGRLYEVYLRFKMVVTISPEQAELGEYVFEKTLYEHEEVFTEDAVGHLLPTTGFVFGDEIRVFSKESPGLWKRVK